ncbi:Uncharacterised protein [Aeromonas encheleia]|nr:Uncharacterised protein [Aeromonas encheleia]
MAPFLIVLCIMNIDTIRMPGINTLLLAIDDYPTGKPHRKSPLGPILILAPLSQASHGDSVKIDGSGSFQIEEARCTRI